MLVGRFDSMYYIGIAIRYSVGGIRQTTSKLGLSFTGMGKGGFVQKLRRCYRSSIGRGIEI